MSQRINAGFVICKAVRIENEEIVMGVNSAETWVTWRCEPEHDHYFWGHYFSTKENAEIDFYERLKDLAETYIGVAKRRKLDKEHGEEACK